MKLKSIIPVILAVVFVSGCADIRRLEDLKISGVKIEKMNMEGLKGLALQLAVDVDNPGAQVSLSDISGEIEHSGKVLGTVAVAPFVLKGKTSETYHIDAELRLGRNVTVLELGRLLDKDILDEVLVDVSACVRIKKGKTRTFEMKDMPVKDIVEAFDK